MNVFAVKNYVDLLLCSKYNSELSILENPLEVLNLNNRKLLNNLYDPFSMRNTLY
jgi:hypothetical protein